MNRVLALCLATVALFGSESGAIAAPPEGTDPALTESCNAARILDECPTCQCTVRGAMQRFPGTEAGGKPRLIGAVIDLIGKRTDGADTAAAHIVLCKDMKLTHFGRLVAGDYETAGLAGALEACPQVHERDTDGVLLPFEVKSRERVTKTLEDGTLEATVTEKTEPVDCREGPGGLGCTAVPLALEKRIERASGQDLKPVVVSTEGYLRTWKLDKKPGYIAFSKATGKLAKALARPGAHKVESDMLSGEDDSRRFVIKW